MKRHPHQQHRRGTVTVIMLVIIVVLSTLMGQFVRRALVDRREVRRDLQYVQTTELAAAGIQRLIRRRAADRGYPGETWTLGSGQIHQTNSAAVTITLTDGSATVVAQYPTNEEFPCQVTRRIRLDN